MVLASQSAPVQIEAKVAYDEASALYDLRFFAMGTSCKVLFATPDLEMAKAFVQEAVHWVANFEGKYSRFRDDSLISEINRNAGKGWTAIDGEVESIFGICDELNLMTHGVLDPTMLPLIDLWDFKKKRSELPGNVEIGEAMKRVGWQKVKRKPGAVLLPEEGMALDFGGFGKEYAVDKVAAMAVGYGLEGCLVDFGRDIHAVGVPPGRPAWHVGLENPEKPGSSWGSVGAMNVGIATSGDYCRYFEYENIRYGHIVDPRTGKPVRNRVLAVSVVANSCLEAGVLSTAAFVLGEDEGMELIEDSFGMEGCLFMENGLRQSGGFMQYVVQ